MAAKKTLVLGLIAVVIAFLAGRQYGRQSTPQPLVEPILNNQSAAPDALRAPTVQSSRPSTPRPRIDPALRTQLFEEYRCPQAACGLSPFIAENENEAVWLRLRGYPSPKQREEAERLPTSELKLRADRGDLVYASLYGERLMQEGNWKDSYGVLLKAATNGSLYSLYALSYRSGNHPEYKDAIDSRAYLRAAYLAGDYKAPLQLIKTFPQFNGTSDDLLTEELAAHRFRNLMRYRMYPRPPTKE